MDGRIDPRNRGCSSILLTTWETAGSFGWTRQSRDYRLSHSNRRAILDLGARAIAIGAAEAHKVFVGSVHCQATNTRNRIHRMKRPRPQNATMVMITGFPRRIDPVSTRRAKGLKEHTKGGNPDIREKMVNLVSRAEITAALWRAIPVCQRSRS